MGWLETLYNSYQYLEAQAGKNSANVENLLPPAVIVQNAQVEITLNMDGNFVRAKFVEKEDAKTRTPCTEKSASRTSKPEPHCLFDNMMYLAGDFDKYFVTEKKSDELRNNNFLPYMENLRLWVESDFANDNIKAVYEYLRKETLAGDLLSAKILQLDEKNRVDLSEKHNGITPDKFFIRFAIQHEGVLHRLWEDMELLKDYSQYYMSGQFQQNHEEFCYVNGKAGYMSELHGKYIRYPGDGAKLISANDLSNFTFRGRFERASEALNISYEVSEKAHSALRYLINKQAYKKNGFTVIAWADGIDIPQPAYSTSSIFGDMSEDDNLTAIQADTEEDFAKRMSLALAGYYADLTVPIKVNLLAIDAASPGRMAVQYFKTFAVNDYIERLVAWHSDLSWQRWYKKKDEEKARLIVGAPSPEEICLAAFGHEQGGKLVINENDKFINAQLKRILCCIAEGNRLPSDFMYCAYRNAINPAAKKTQYVWVECLQTACSLIKKYYIDKGRKWNYMSLDKNMTDRSYLFGRLLAVADKVEEAAIFKQENRNSDSESNASSGKRLTAAKRYMNMFAKRPASTWVNINAKLTPYWTVLTAEQQDYYRNLMSSICELFEYGDFKNKKALEPSFLLGYYQQRKVLRFNKKQNEENVVGGNSNVK